MYYSFYMNERLLLDEWKYYQRKGECNWLLKRTLMNDNTRTAEEKKQFYYDNRRVVNHYSDFFKEQANEVFRECCELRPCFDSEEEYEYYLDHKYLNDDYELMDYGRKQKLFNMYRRYNDLTLHANDKTEVQLSFEPIKSAKFREHNFILINRKDIKFIREVRKYNDLTIPQIEILFGVIFFCRMHNSERANLNTPFRIKQFLGCFDNATIEDLEYVVDVAFDIEDEDIVYHPYNNIELDDDWLSYKVTRFNNKLDLTKVSRYFITDLTTKKYCRMCLKPFEPTNNRQKVCECCKPKADAIKAKMRKTKQRYIQANGKDACCGVCTNCTNADCDNWWRYWSNELPFLGNMTDEQANKEIDDLLYKIENVYTDEEKSEILPWDMIYKYKGNF